MAHPLSFFQRMMLPFMGPAAIAKMLSRLPPRSASFVLEGFPTDRSYKILTSMEEPVKQRLFNSMSNFYLTKIIKKLPAQVAASTLTTLQAATVRKISKMLTELDIQEMMSYWSDKDLVFILTNFHPTKASFMMSEMPEQQQTVILPQLQTWVQAALIKDLPAELRSEVIDKMSLEAAIDLLTRWSMEDQSAALRGVRQQRQQEIFNTMRPRTIAELLEYWPQEEVLRMMNSLDSKQMTLILYNFEDKYKKGIFKMIAPSKQKYVIENLQTNQALTFLRFLEEDEIRAHLNEMDADTRRLLIRGLESMD